MKKGIVEIVIVVMVALTWAGTASANDLVVHEWGTFTAVAGADGELVSWRPLIGPSDLPGFVYEIGEGAAGLRSGARAPSKGDMEGTIRMETPVIYFYTEQEMDVSVSVGFPSGRITEWYPRANQVGRTIDWGKFRLMPGLDAKLPQESGRSHYYPARNVDAVPLRVRGHDGDEFEKFLFYRGVGSFALPLEVKLESERLKIKEIAGRPLGSVVVFERWGEEFRWSIHHGRSASLSAQRPKVSRPLSELLEQLEGILMESGLFEKEAKAMVDTWKDHWFEDGLRVFTVIDREATDKLLPLTISPTPKSIERVLVGRVEVIRPEDEVAVLSLTRAAMKAVGVGREAIIGEMLARYGRFAGPILQRVRGQLTEIMDFDAVLAQVLRRSAVGPNLD